VVAYYGSTAFADLGEATKAYRRRLIEKLRPEFGQQPVTLWTGKHIDDLLQKVAKPTMRKQWLKTLRGLFGYAVAIQMLPFDPSASIKLKHKKTDGHATWDEDWIEVYRAHHKLGGQARLALELLLNTAQRRGDVVRMGPQHVRQTPDGQVIAVTQEKGGAKLVIPLHADLVAAIKATPCGHLSFLVTEYGRPRTSAGFGNWFAEQCEAAGVPSNLRAHGLRKAACCRLAEAGCTEKEIAAISGHSSLDEVRRYTEKANQARLARAAMNKIATSSVKPTDPECKIGSYVVEK
jgi:integrase